MQQRSAVERLRLQQLHELVPLWQRRAALSRLGPPSSATQPQSSPYSLNNGRVHTLAQTPTHASTAATSALYSKPSQPQQQHGFPALTTLQTTAAVSAAPATTTSTTTTSNTPPLISPTTAGFAAQVLNGGGVQMVMVQTADGPQWLPLVQPATPTPTPQLPLSPVQQQQLMEMLLRLNQQQQQQVQGIPPPGGGNAASERDPRRQAGASGGG